MDLKKGWNISSSLSHRVTIAITVSAGKRSRLGLPWTVIKNTSRLPWLHTFDFNWNFVHRGEGVMAKFSAAAIFLRDAREEKDSE